MIKYCQKCGSAHSVKYAQLNRTRLCRCGGVVVEGTANRKGNSEQKPISRTPTPAPRKPTSTAPSPPPADTRIHCLVSVEGPCVLTPDKPFYIGRDVSSDIRLVDTAVSRRHAKIERAGSAVVLIDLGSQNGVFINNKPAQRKTLVNHDDIRIAGESFTYRIVRTLRELRDSVRVRRSRSLSDSTVELVPIAAFISGDEFRGTIAAISMCDVCQMLSLSHRSGRLILSDTQGIEARIHFNNGEIVYAFYGDEAGDAAALRLLSAPAGTFIFEAGQSAHKPNINQPTSRLMMESLRLKDEQRM